MSYCDASDVARYNIARGTYSASSHPTASQVVLFIDEISSEMDTRLRTAGYVVPIASSFTTDRAFLRGINAVGAAWKVEVAAPTSDNESMYKTMYQSALKMLGSIELESPKDTAQTRIRSGFTTSPMVGIPTHTLFVES